MKGKGEEKEKRYNLIDDVKRSVYKKQREWPRRGRVGDNSGKRDLTAGRTRCDDDSTWKFALSDICIGHIILFNRVNDRKYNVVVTNTQFYYFIEIFLMLCR